MRCHLIIVASMVAVVAGRRGSPAPPPVAPVNKHYGWGLTGPLYPPPPAEEDKHQKVKEVKHVKRGKPFDPLSIEALPHNNEDFDNELCSKSYLTYID